MQIRPATAIVLVTLLGLAPATPAASAPTQEHPDAARALAQVRPGLRVRLEARDGRVVEGRYIEIADGDVVLDEPGARIPAASIQRVWLRGRATKNGAILGGILLASPVRGWAKGRDRNSAPGGLGGRVGLAADLPGGFAPGLEFGRFTLGHGEVVSPHSRALHFNESVRHFGLTLTKTRDRGRLRPYGLASVGHYSWHGFDSFALDPDFDFVDAETHRSFFGASLGGGARYRARRSLSLEVEGRWHTSLHAVARPTFDGPAQHWNMVSLTAGAKLLW